nr:uncharacterized protein LOC112769687 [Arachis hypogaea]
MKQGDLSITTYFTKFKGIWEELDEFKQIPSCDCGASCSCGLKIIREYRDQEHAVRILRGLNDQYTTVKSQIMLMVPLSSVNSIYSLLLQQERQLSNSDQSEERMLVNVVNIGGTGNENNREFGMTLNANSSITNRGGRGGRDRGRGRVSSGREMMRSCSYCGKAGHTIETCYHKHGFPPHLQKKFGVANVNNMIVAEKICVDGNVTDVHSTQEENSKSLDNLFFEDKKQALISLFQQHKGDPAHSSLQTQAINTMIAPSAGIYHILSVSHIPLHTHDWIIDTGATAHVTFSLDTFHSHHTIDPMLIKCPNGTETTATISGTIILTRDFYLTNVLYVPSFNFNLISVSEATDFLPCQFLFNNTHCEIQDNLFLKMIGHARQRGGLYIFNTDAIYVNLGAKNRELVNTSNSVSVAAVTYTINHET